MRRAKAYRRAFARGLLKGLPAGVWAGWYARRMYRMGVAAGVQRECELWLELVDSGAVKIDSRLPATPATQQADGVEEWRGEW